MPVQCTCETCGKMFSRPPSMVGRYCSNVCRGRAFGGEKSCHWKGGLVTYTCENPACGKTFERAPSQAKGRPFCSPACKRAHVRGANAGARWKGGRRIDEQGYVVLHAPNHPNANKAGYIHEHVAVAAVKIGRPLRKGEVVHHRDRDRANNHPDNLDVLTASEHTRLHHENGDIHRNKRSK